MFVLKCVSSNSANNIPLVQEMLGRKVTAARMAQKMEQVMGSNGTDDVLDWDGLQQKAALAFASSSD
eukprot:10445463-Heterocapsa_arctica.AAC.1